MGRQEAKRTTLADIAAATGYSVNTISHALKNKADIAPATRERIQQAAREMGYVRNEAARSLRSGRTKTLGVIVGGMYNPFYKRQSNTRINNFDYINFGLRPRYILYIIDQKSRLFQILNY